MQSLLAQALKENRITLNDEKQQQLLQFLALLQKWNRTFNITTLDSPKDMIYLHLIDSLIIKSYLKGNRFLDVGSGGGLPGIPLAIAHPHQHWTLLDKNSKKTRFLTQVVAECGLQNVQIAHSRCEDFQPPHCFDSILSRAFGSLALFVNTTNHLLCEDGRFLAMKGKVPEDELHELPADYTVQAIHPLTIKGVTVERHLIELVCVKF